LRRGGDLIEMSEQRYATEADLQVLLARHPHLLTADGEPHRWVLVSREFGVASEQDGSDRWSVDHLFLDEAAVPTLVEVKRSTDTRIRREVVGQILDYAANALSHWSLGTIRARFETACAGSDPAEVLAAALGGEVDAEAFWETVGTNLAAGHVRLVFVADVIPSELRAIVEFLNEQMSTTEVLAIEIRQYVDESGEHQTLVPRMIGQTQAARRAKGRTPRVSWDLRAWLAAFREARGEQEAGVAERLLVWAMDHEPPLTTSFGSGAKDPSAKVSLPGSVAPFAIYRGYTRGRVELQFARLSSTPPFDAPATRRELQTRLNEIPGVAISEDQLEKYPSIPVAAVLDQDAFDRFTDAMDWIIGETAQRSQQL
jgi:hypothetical protein